jgi:hypothetical protein
LPQSAADAETPYCCCSMQIFTSAGSGKPSAAAGVPPSSFQREEGCER